MKTSVKIQKFCHSFKLILAVITSLIVIGLPYAAYADTAPLCTDNSPSCGGPSGNVSSTTSTTTSTGACKDTTNSAGKVSSSAVQKCLDQSPIVHDLQTIVDFMSALIGIVVIGVIIIGGIQYSMAGGSPDATGKAKQRIINGVLALIVFIFTFAFLQWLIPGGIFS